MSIVIVAAHPDDELLGMGTLVPLLNRRFTVIHVTDGAPRSGSDVSNSGCATWQEYAALRRAEFEKALTAAGGSDHPTVCLNCPDQQAAFRIADHVRDLAEMFDKLRPSFVFTHAFEGGHPDHDAIAAAVHGAIYLRRPHCTLMEFTGYHAGPNGMECECFLENPTDVLPRPLNSRQIEWKREVLSCYASQARVLAQFPLKFEPLRLAPQYDFLQPPHQGCLYYEHFDWGVNGAEWRRLAEQAFRDLKIPCVC